MIPLRDSNPGFVRPYVTIILIAASLWAWMSQAGSPEPDAQVYRLATIPCELTTGEPLSAEEIVRSFCDPAPGSAEVFAGKSIPLSLLASLFLHGGWAHVIGNMWTLWIFGNNVEDAFGRIGYALFYLVAGVVASLAHVALNPASTVPVVGASGAIAGVMGAYLVLFPGARVTTLVGWLIVPVRAWFFLIVWLASQFLLSAGDSNIAWEAHVGGFLFGLTVTVLARRRLVARLRSHHFPFRQPGR